MSQTNKQTNKEVVPSSVQGRTQFFLYNTKGSALRLGIIQTEMIMFRNICVYTHTYLCSARSKRNRGHEFERDQGRIYKRILRKEREGKML